MSARSIVPLLLVVIVLAVVGTLFAITQLGYSIVQTESDTGDPRQVLVTVEVLITATRDPNATQEVMIVTATPDRTQLAVPDVVLTDSANVASAPTVDPNDLDAQGLTAQSAEGESQSLPENCLIHVVESGDTVYFVAEEYDVDYFLMLEVNNLQEDTLLNIGDELIVPLEGCDAGAIPTSPPEPTATPNDDEATETATAGVAATETQIALASPTSGPTATPSVTPTITLVPTATNAQIEVTGIQSAGDVTAEGVVLRNVGNTVDLTGWTLSDFDGNEFTFPELLFFSETTISVFTRTGQNTPISLFWGLDEPVWNDGDVLTLTDSDGDVQATLRVGSSIDLQ
ncbi:MAG: lamin tail domain-containing protein [Anaerolineaceae bacterium]|nr:lamin tail domain-containing protein [Anaerolineaceae bacterium]